jgi:hypothetical protein
MRIIAPMMILIMMTSTLAGCTGGDPDGGGEMDTDAINDLIDANLQDFINNTTITVNQEIHHHYYNNTTVNEGDLTNNDYTVEYNNTTVNEGDSIVNEGDDNNLNEWSNTSYNLGGANFGNGVNGTVYSGTNLMFVAHLDFSAMDLFPEYNPSPAGDSNNNFSYTWTYYDYLTNSDRTDLFTFSCQEFYIIGSQSNNSSAQVTFWENDNNYWNAWNNEYNSTVADLLQDAGNDWSIEVICNENYVPHGGPIKIGNFGDEPLTFFSIDIPVGYAIEYIQLDTKHDYFGSSSNCYLFQQASGSGCWDVNNSIQRSESLYYNYSSGPPPGYSGNYYGGWDNITVDFDFGFSEGYNSYYDEIYGNGYYGDGQHAIWPTSNYEFTLYYQFVPVIPVE